MISKQEALEELTRNLIQAEQQVDAAMREGKDDLKAERQIFDLKAKIALLDFDDQF